MSIADRSVLACWGVRGGQAGRPFSVVIDPGGPNERVVDALADAVPVRAGEIIRIRTTGGGGWGDPLDRPYAEVLRDVAWGKVSVAGAWADYGVRIVPGGDGEGVAGGDGEGVAGGDGDGFAVDEAASDAERARRRAARPAVRPFFDRGPGFATLSGGAPHAEVDLV